MPLGMEFWFELHSIRERKNTNFFPQECFFLLITSNFIIIKKKESYFNALYLNIEIKYYNDEKNVQKNRENQFFMQMMVQDISEIDKTLLFQNRKRIN